MQALDSTAATAVQIAADAPSYQFDVSVFVLAQAELSEAELSRLVDPLVDIAELYSVSFIGSVKPSEQAKFGYNIDGSFVLDGLSLEDATILRDRVFRLSLPNESIRIKSLTASALTEGND